MIFNISFDDDIPCGNSTQRTDESITDALLRMGVKQKYVDVITQEEFEDIGDVVNLTDADLSQLKFKVGAKKTLLRIFEEEKNRRVANSINVGVEVHALDVGFGALDIGNSYGWNGEDIGFGAFDYGSNGENTQRVLGDYRLVSLILFGMFSWKPLMAIAKLATVNNTFALGYEWMVCQHMDRRFFGKHVWFAELNPLQLRVMTHYEPYKRIYKHYLKGRYVLQ